MKSFIKKLIVRTVSATLLMTSLPMLNSYSTLYSPSTQFTSVEAASNASRFLHNIRSLPSVSSIHQIVPNIHGMMDFQTTKSTILNVRIMYNQLSTREKSLSEIKRWEGYLTLKETAIGIPFIQAVRSLPSVSQLQAMTEREVKIIAHEMNELRTKFNQLPNITQMDTEVQRWEGFLAEKEDAVGISFIHEARSLPNLAVIQEMNAEQRIALENELQVVWKLYDSLAIVAQKDIDVARWVGYLTQKEEIIAFGEPEIQARMTDIRHRWNELKPVKNQVEFAEKPSTDIPYVLGQLANTTLNEALNITNFLRFIAYLPDNVNLNDFYSNEAQAASLVNAINDDLTHYPKKPPHINQDTFDAGYKGASTSNIGRGYLSLPHSILSGYMYDGHASNISDVGHRLWILSPQLQEVGFGYVNGHTAMKVMGDEMMSNSYAPFDFVSWPAETAMPLNIRGDSLRFFGANYPWSISLNHELYNNEAIENIQVTLTRLNDHKMWQFNRKSADGYFNVSTNPVGYLPYTVIFRPNGLSYKSGDRFNVEISGVQSLNGSEETIRYETTFFDLD